MTNRGNKRNENFLNRPRYTLFSCDGTSVVVFGKMLLTSNFLNMEKLYFFFVFGDNVGLGTK